MNVDLGRLKPDKPLRQKAVERGFEHLGYF